MNLVPARPKSYIQKAGPAGPLKYHKLGNGGMGYNYNYYYYYHSSIPYEPKVHPGANPWRGFVKEKRQALQQAHE